MSQQFRTVTTNAGRNAVREALTQGKTVKLSHMSVGDGGGNPVTPLSTMTKLVNERFRAQINDIVLDPATPDLFTSELFIPQAEGGWYIREVGLWMDDGTLFAVGNTPLTEKPDISSGAATDLLVRLIIRVLDAATISIEIDPAQVLATREYVDRKLDAHNNDGGAHETLARKSVQIKAGTGLTGGGTLEADRTLTIKYGNTAGTACQGNDVRLADARTPKPHKATHQTGGSDAITPADIGAADKTIQIKPGTGLTGGGTLEADRTLTVSYGTAAGTACQGNDARLSNARTPTAHKATHKTGGTDALTPADIGAVPMTVQVIAGTGLSGGGSLTANRTLTVKYGTGAGTACQGNDARVTASEAFRLSMIGVPRYWRSTTLPAGHVWANGDLALFADWPELKKIYDAGGFAGMLLAYNANSATIAANLGKWRPNAANPTGLYVPNLSEQFFRGWTGGAGREAGSWQGDAIRNVTGSAGIGGQTGIAYPLAMDGNTGALCPQGEKGTHSLSTMTSVNTYGGLVFDASHAVPTAAENRPVNIAVPVILYLGLSA
ncbi:phage tail protein [Bilophila wadsworthia]|uniref:phage tail protein n=1 Tax=Bilophila wadsworthia TaxID=35833 RepID=UPI002432718E|nr:phage tail protein [Bilophila wadsworthia]